MDPVDESIDWRPQQPPHQRLNADPHDWSPYSVNDQIGVFLGNTWRRGVIRQLDATGALVRAKHLGSRSFSLFRVFDARNICPARLLLRHEPDDSSPLLDLIDIDTHIQHAKH